MPETSSFKYLQTLEDEFIHVMAFSSLCLDLFAEETTVDRDLSSYGILRRIYPRRTHISSTLRRKAEISD